MKKQRSTKTSSTERKRSNLVDPPDGDINVDPQVEVLISFEVEDETWETDVFVEINGTRVVENGVSKNGWTTTRFYKQGNFGHVGVRKPGGMPRRDIFVKAWCNNAFTVDQRFFVKDASAYKMRPDNGVKIPNGWFSIGGEWDIRGEKFEELDHLGQGIPCKDLCAIYPGDNTVGFLREGEVEWRFVPDGVFDGMKDVDMARVDDGYALVVLTDKKTRLVKHGLFREFNDTGQSVEITDRFINISKKEETHHLPVNYEPSPLEDTFRSWYMMTCERDGNWRHQFGDDLFLWIKEDEMVAMIDPDPFLDQADSILWRRNDVQTSFRDIDILDREHIVVNNEVFVNVNNPQIDKI